LFIGTQFSILYTSMYSQAEATTLRLYEVSRRSLSPSCTRTSDPSCLISSLSFTITDNNLHTLNRHGSRWICIHIRTALSSVSDTRLPLSHSVTTYYLHHVLPSLLLAQWQVSPARHNRTVLLSRLVSFHALSSYAPHAMPHDWPRVCPVLLADAGILANILHAHAQVRPHRSPASARPSPAEL
jgi:hypothetical protein